GWFFNRIRVGTIVGLLLFQCHLQGECGPCLACAGGAVDDGVTSRGLSCVEDSCKQVRVTFTGANLLSVGPVEGELWVPCVPLSQHCCSDLADALYGEVFPQLFLAYSGGGFSQNFFVLISVLLPSGLRVEMRCWLALCSELRCTVGWLVRSGGSSQNDALVVLVECVAHTTGCGRADALSDPYRESLLLALCRFRAVDIDECVALWSGVPSLCVLGCGTLCWFESYSGQCAVFDLCGYLVF
ncbi:hypothetical protein Taro_056987, partial [Colocasia esculenta]|nr:hypothetical protein [Colocasia esculenta]